MFKTTGIDHVAVNTDDMEATLRFYCGVLGMRLARTSRTGDGRRHYNGSFMINSTAQGAKARTYYLLLDVTSRPPTMVSSGYYDDVFTRTAHGWRIQHRTLHGDGPAR